MTETGNHIRLFRSFIEGDNEAFEKLYQLYFPRLYSFSCKIVNDSDIAKDIVQNAFIKLWGNRSSINPDNPEALLYKMVRNACLNHIKHLKVVENIKAEVQDQYMGEELYYIDMVGDKPYILIEKELRDKILEVVDSLPDKCRQVFRMSRIDGMKNREIAEKLDISLKTVEKHISKALLTLKSNMGEYLSLNIILLVIGMYR